MSEDLIFSPWDVRYKKDLPRILSEQALLEAQVDVEKAWLLTLSEKGIAPKTTDAELSKIFAGLSFSEIEDIEVRTKHATRALVEALADRLRKNSRADLAEWVHVGLTSFDTVDTALRLRLKRFFEQDFVKASTELRSELVRLANAFKDTQCVGRTHGQWAVPSLFGLGFAEAAERLAQIEIKIKAATNDLRGQSSGAIGGYHASGLFTDKPLELEEAFLKHLGLKPHYSSVQILPPEDVLDLASQSMMWASVSAKVAGDLRHLARSEIGEVSEGMEAGQVGSSTMPQKRNPWNLEHVCSLFKILQSRFDLLKADLVTEHQRDLTNSASGRFHIETFICTWLMARRLTKILSKLQIDTVRIDHNLKASGGSVFAEALYVLATREGIANSHDVIREASREGEKTGKDLFDVVASKEILKSMPTKPELIEKVLAGSRQKLDLILKRLKADGTK